MIYDQESTGFFTCLKDNPYSTACAASIILGIALVACGELSKHNAGKMSLLIIGALLILVGISAYAGKAVHALREGGKQQQYRAIP